MAESGPEAAPELPVQCIGALGAVRDGDDNALVLTSDQLQEIDDFCNQLQGKADDDDKLQLCAEKCNELLRHETRLQILIATYDDVMSVACCAYKNKKLEKTSTKMPLPTGRNKKAGNNTVRDEWERFFGVAALAAQVKSTCLVALKAVVVRWGREVVLHYPWASKGEYFWNLLRAAALDVPKWSDAALALNIIMYRRHVTIRRHCSIAYSRDPITASDLKELKGFPLAEIRDRVLPAGFGLDEFGIIVHEQFAGPRPLSNTRLPAESDLPTESSDGAGDSELSDPPETDTESSEPPTGSQHSEAADAGPIDDIATNGFVDELMREMDLPDPLNSETNPLKPPTMSLRERTQLSYKEARSRGSRTTRSTPIKAPVASEVPPPTCCPVPSTLLDALDNTTTFKPENFFAIRGQLCHYHTKRLLDQVWTIQSAPPAEPPTCRRTTSLSDITQTFKRPRLEEPLPLPSGWLAQGTAPPHDRETDDAYRKQVLAELQYPTHQLPPGSHGKQIADSVQALLREATPPNTDSSRGPVEALFCTGSEAADLVESISSHIIPIITEGQQQFRWSENDRPIAQFFRRMTLLDRMVSVQIPSRSLTKDSFEARTLGAVQQRFLSRGDTIEPWKILDLQSPLPSSILPRFLTGENCGLLVQVRNTILMEQSAERVTAPSQNWNQWKNVLEWVLLSEGGHHTAPHMDSHGFDTWITVQEECMGFGWKANPTEEEKEWMTNDSCTGGRWRYVVLKPGQTIFFKSGTIHFVFRTRDPQTLALGGHVLQWSGIERWMRIILAQMADPMITNEDMEQSALMYVHAVSKLVATRMAEDRIEELGGAAAVKRFLTAVQEFNKLYVPQRKRRAR